MGFLDICVKGTQSTGLRRSTAGGIKIMEAITDVDVFIRDRSVEGFNDTVLMLSEIWGGIAAGRVALPSASAADGHYPAAGILTWAETNGRVSPEHLESLNRFACETGVMELGACGDGRGP
jgi:hypothetical protein